MATTRSPTSSEWTKLAASLGYVIWFIVTFWPWRKKELAVCRGLAADAVDHGTGAPRIRASTGSTRSSYARMGRGGAQFGWSRR